MLVKRQASPQERDPEVGVQLQRRSTETAAARQA
jgi:hypothetical protein